MSSKVKKVSRSTTSSSILSTNSSISRSGPTWESEMKATTSRPESRSTTSMNCCRIASWNALQSLHSKLLYDVAAIAYGTSAATPQFITDTTKANVSPNAIYVNKGYLEAMIIVAALKGCGYPCTGSQLETQINKVSISTGGMIQGGIHYSASNHQAVSYMAGFQWATGASAPVKVATNLKAGT